MNPQEVSAIQEWPAPQDKKGVQRFIGFPNFYRRFNQEFLWPHRSNYTTYEERPHFPLDACSADRFGTAEGSFHLCPILQHLEPALTYVLEARARVLGCNRIVI